MSGSIENGCGFLLGLAISLTALKILGLVSWSWFWVTFPVTFTVYFFAALGAGVFGFVALCFFVEFAIEGFRK
jgi:hypothetical protein